jgi:protein-L-isoaspartate(D-aspartate) O-methyltransferase
VTDPARLATIRRFFAQLIMPSDEAADSPLENAFAETRREDFLGPGPWLIRGGKDYVPTPDADPSWLYQNVLVALDASRRVNNGEPLLHARCLSTLALKPGEHVVHVGAGSGYYTAILADLVGSKGRVDAFEIDSSLAAWAARNLAARPAVAVHAESGTVGALPEADAIYVCAGATHPAAGWLAALKPGGRLIFPLTGANDWGGMLLVSRGASPDRFAASILMRVGFIPCEGARNTKEARALSRSFVANAIDEVQSLRLGVEPGDATVWFAGEGWFLSRRPPEGPGS